MVHWLNYEEGVLLSDGDYTLNYKTSMGHTPHMVHPFDEKIIYLADLVPTSAHISIPWVMGYDMSPGDSTINKEDFYQFMVQKNLIGLFEHDPDYWGATVYKDGRKWKAKERFSAPKEKAFSVGSTLG